MRKSKYIDTVLSYISSKRNKASVEAELYDHIDECSKLYVEYGYDESDAWSHAENRMGDADFTGEQLNALDKSRTFKKYLYFLLALLPIIPLIPIYCNMWDMSKMFSSTLMSHIYEISIGRFYVFALPMLVYLFGFINLALGFKKKKCTNIITSSLSIITVSVTGPYSLYYLINGMPNFSKYIELLFSDYSTVDRYDTGRMLSIYPTSSVIVSAVVIVVTLFMLVSGLVIIFRIRSLTNGIKDLKLARALSIISMIISVVLFVLITSVTISIISSTDSIVEAHQDVIKQEEKSLIENVQRFITADEDELFDACGDLFTSYQFRGGKTHFYPDSSDREKLYQPYVTDFGIVGFDGLEYILAINDCVINPFCWSDPVVDTLPIYADCSSLTGRTDLTIDDMPLPADIDMRYHTDGFCSLQFSYDGKVNFYFQYDYNKNDFVLTYSSLADFEEIDELDPALTIMFDDYLKGSLGEYDALYKEIYSLRYNKELDTYIADMTYAGYDVGSYSGRYGYYCSDYQSYEGVTAVFRFDENGCQELYLSFLEDDDLIYSDEVMAKFEKAGKNRTNADQWRSFLSSYHTSYAADLAEGTDLVSIYGKSLYSHEYKDGKLTYKEGAFADENFYTDSTWSIAWSNNDKQSIKNATLVIKDGDTVLLHKSLDIVEIESEDNYIHGWNRYVALDRSYTVKCSSCNSPSASVVLYDTSGNKYEIRLDKTPLNDDMGGCADASNDIIITDKYNNVFSIYDQK